MSILASGRARALLVANLVAAALLLISRHSVSAQWETYCPPQATGCDCLEGAPLNPDGCYDNLGDEFLCSSNAFCTEPE